MGMYTYGSVGLHQTAKQPATKGIHVEFKPNAEMSKLNSVLLIPSSCVNLDLIGLRI